MLIGGNIRLSKEESVIISTTGNHLEEAQSFPYIGLVINKNLTWEDHIDYINHKINKKLDLLRRIKSSLPLNARLIFFNSVILPFFNYGDIILETEVTIPLWPSYKFFTIRPHKLF